MVPIKFRCYRCGKLLGVSPTKAGAVVSCPQCAAELVVPEPDEIGADADTPPDPPTSALDTGLALDNLDIRPEDIRVEPGSEPIRPAVPSPEFMHATVVLAETPPRDVPRPVPTPEPPRQEVQAPLSTPDPLPIRVEPALSPTSHRQGAAPVRSRDLIIPRSVVASWSLFVLLGLVFAFFTGLLAGHYVWRAH